MKNIIVGSIVKSDDGLIGEVTMIQNGIVTIKQDNGTVVYRYLDRVGLSRAEFDMEEITLEDVESILAGRISKNPNRFEGANGILFTVDTMTIDVEDYLYSVGAEFYKVAEGLYYSETVMSVSEFIQLKHVVKVKHLA